MNVEAHELTIKLKNISITPDHTYYRPPSWPPPYDWVVSEDSHGNPLSRWMDDTWDFSPWAGKSFKLDFAGGRATGSTPPLGTQNQFLLRLLTTWLIWGPKGEKAWRTLKSRFGRLRRIIALCEREAVLASDLMRYPKLVDRIPEVCGHLVEKKKLIFELDRLQLARNEIGFTLVDESGITRLAAAINLGEEREAEQTAYIPSRIWEYQVLRLRECIDDFLMHRQQIEDCFHFCVDAYALNFESLEAALLPKGTTNNRLPFTVQRHQKPGARTGRQFHGHFRETASRFGIDRLLCKWIAPNIRTISIKSLSGYLTLIQYVSLTYIANFTLQRIEEVASLRSDCLIWEEDPTLGRIPIICGETTKTDKDNDARWPTSPSVSIAVEAATSVANLRMRCAAANIYVNCSSQDQQNPILFHRAFEPWCSAVQINYTTRPHLDSYMTAIKRFPQLFDSEQITITQSDLAQARMLTPNLHKGGKFSVGNIWPFTYHQLRRTSAVNMFASELLCDSSMQLIMKHRSILQAAYYGRNHTRLRFNEEVEDLVAGAKYEVMAHQVESLVKDRYISPAGSKRKAEMVVELIGNRDFKELSKAGTRGEISFRETRLGGCTKVGHCEYGGIESVARCAGGDGRAPCRDAVFDRSKQRDIERQLDGIEHKRTRTEPDSPRQRALQAEEQGLRNYLDAIRT